MLAGDDAVCRVARRDDVEHDAAAGQSEGVGELPGVAVRGREARARERCGGELEEEAAVRAGAGGVDCGEGERGGGGRGVRGGALEERVGHFVGVLAGVDLCLL
jgi:hypothetical protein